MSILIQYLTSGLLLGSIYAIIALGVVIIYKSTRVFNFAQGHFLVWGVLISYWTINKFGVPLGLFISLICSIVMGYLIERLTLRPLIGQPLLAALLMTLSLSYLLEGFAYMSWGTAVRAYPELFPSQIWKGISGPIPSGGLNLGFVKINYTQLLSFIGALVLFGLFILFYNRVRIGKAMKAVAEDHQVSQSLGIKVRWIFSLSWIIASMVGFIGSIFVGSISGAFIGLSDLGLRAIPALLIGGLDSIPGTLLGGFIVGVLQALATGYFGAGMGNVSPFIVLLLILLIKPYGLFGQVRIERL